MTSAEPRRTSVEELRYALAQSTSTRPPGSLRPRVLQAAMAARPPGVATGTESPITPAEAYRRTTLSLDSLLSRLTDSDWRRHALRDLDVQGLLGHLIGVERQLHAAIGIGPAVVTSADHVASTQGDARAQAARPASKTHADWLDLSMRTVEYATGLDRETSSRPVTLHTFTIPFERMLVVRTFETWTHEEDIRRALRYPLSPPDSARLRLMTDLAVSALPTGLARIGRPQPERTARIVLTGPGGGTWQAALDRGVGGPIDVRIVADAATFCRLVANRASPAELDPAVSGDEDLAALVLAGAQALALD